MNWAKQNRLWPWIAALLPAAGLFVIVVRAEVAVHTGPSFRIAIRGFDPRDLFRGHYLQYQFDFNWAGEDTCDLIEVDDKRATFPGGRRPAAFPSDRRPVAGCCLCLTRTASNGSNPQVRQVGCDDTWLHCDGWMASSEVVPPLRYFVPEDRARELERALNSRAPSVEVAVPRSGKPAIKELYLGDRPWRDAVGKSP